MDKSKKALAVLAGLLLISTCAFEISEISRFVSMISGGNPSYISSLAIKVIFVSFVICAGIFTFLGKTEKPSAFCMIGASAVALYNTASYLISIMGNSMVFGIVYGNAVKMLQIALFAIPAAIFALSRANATNKTKNKFLIALSVAFAIVMSGKIIYFAAWGKTFADIPLFFDVYGLDTLQSVIYLVAFLLIIITYFSDKRKKYK